jgi:hypothetical protein
MLGTSVLNGSAAGRNRFIGQLMEGFPCALGCCPGAVEAKDLGRMTTLV